MHTNTGIDTGPGPTGGAYSQVDDGVGQEAQDLSGTAYKPLETQAVPAKRWLFILRNEMAPLSSVRPETAFACNSAPAVDNTQSLRKFESHYHQVAPDAPYMWQWGFRFLKGPPIERAGYMYLTSIQRAWKHEPFCIDATFSPLILPIASPTLGMAVQNYTGWFALSA